MRSGLWNYRINIFTTFNIICNGNKWYKYPTYIIYWVLFVVFARSVFSSSFSYADVGFALPHCSIGAGVVFFSPRLLSLSIHFLVISLIIWNGFCLPFVSRAVVYLSFTCVLYAIHQLACISIVYGSIDFWNSCKLSVFSLLFFAVAVPVYFSVHCTFFFSSIHLRLNESHLLYEIDESVFVHVPCACTPWTDRQRLKIKWKKV